MPCWKFSRLDRLDDAIRHARLIETNLTRERCDVARQPGALAQIDRRLVAVRRRIGRLCETARNARRRAREAAAV